jgi:hypothetical protein
VEGVNTFREPTGRLAVGPVRRWVRGKPNLAAPSPDGIIVAPTTAQNVSYRLGVILRAAVVLGTLAVGMTLASWFILATTALSTPNINGTFWTVQRAAWVQGEAPRDSVVVAGDNEVTRDMWGRVDEFFSGIDGANIYQIVATPMQNVYTTPANELVVDGTKTGLTLKAPVAPTALSEAYLGVCVKGSCGKPGTPVELPVTHVVGKVLGGLGLNGWKSAPAFTGSGGNGE